MDDKTASALAEINETVNKILDEIKLTNENLELLIKATQNNRPSPQQPEI